MMLARRSAVTSVQRSLRRRAMTQPPSRAFHLSSAAGKPAGNSRVASAASFFLDAKAACKSKRCALGKDHSGIGANPAACGEDSFFLTPDVVGVADGVGGWNENGVDPGKISRSLMRNAAVFVRQQTANNESATTQQVLAHGYNQALLDDEVEAGSTTACIVRLKQSPEGKPVLEYSNLGDSGFVVIRNGEIIFRSKFQVRGKTLYSFGECGLADGCGCCGSTTDVRLSGMHDAGNAGTLLLWNPLASFVDVIAENPDKAAENIVLASLRHNLKPDDITVVVAKVVVMAAKL
ncbi:unnamed protein product [Phytophthora lilii]|uniref:Protein phosphatase n=1 Tax=Phytophthora lilii TaxID=2077276 RepID=A0A9W7CJV3_9STRA|nr:unnamed protein product [Phytophthora lilii]